MKGNIYLYSIDVKKKLNCIDIEYQRDIFDNDGR